MHTNMHKYLHTHNPIKTSLNVFRHKQTSSNWWQQDHFQKFGTTVRVLLSSNQNDNIYWTLKIFSMERWRGRQKCLLPLNINITIKSILLSWIAWINPNLPICYNISEPQYFNMDSNFYWSLLTDAHSKHILIILVKYPQNFRRLQEWFSEFKWDENRTKTRKSNRLLITKVEFQQHKSFEASEFHMMGWGYYKWNNAVLSLQYN